MTQMDKVPTSPRGWVDDAALCEAFGTTLEGVEADVERHKRGDFSELTFSKPVEGRPIAKAKPTDRTSFPNV